MSSNGASAETRDASAQRLIVLAYITAVAMPLIGLVLGMVVARRPAKASRRHAALIVAISIVATGVWVLILSSGLFTTTSNDLG